MFFNSHLFQCFLQYVAIIVINVIVNPWMLIPAVVMTMLFYSIRLAYLNTGRSFMRIEALSMCLICFSKFWFIFNLLIRCILGRSPIFSHVNATLQGLSTVRAFKATKFLEKEFHEFQDFNTSCYYLFIGASRWFAFWLDIVCLLYVIVVTYSFLIFGSGKYIEKLRFENILFLILNVNFSRRQWQSRFGNHEQY